MKNCILTPLRSRSLQFQKSLPSSRPGVPDPGPLHPPGERLQPPRQVVRGETVHPLILPAWSTATSSILDSRRPGAHPVESYSQAALCAAPWSSTKQIPESSFCSPLQRCKILVWVQKHDCNIASVSRNQAHHAVRKLQERFSRLIRCGGYVTVTLPGLKGKREDVAPRCAHVVVNVDWQRATVLRMLIGCLTWPSENKNL